MPRPRIAVIGGGITGQLVQLQIPAATIYDWQDERQAAKPLTRNFGANYLWEPLPIPGVGYRQFDVVTDVDGQPPTLESVLRYKEKIGKTGDVQDWERQFTRHMTGYDFATPLPAPRIQFRHRVERIDRVKRVIYFAGQTPQMYEYLVSTIPLYSLLNMVGMREPPGRLRHKPIFFKVINRPPDAPHPVDTLYVNYISNPDVTPYRFCDRFGERHYESILPFEGPSVKRYAPGKIFLHPGVDGLLEELQSFGVVTFGRYGSWAPNELIHETWGRIAQWRLREGL